MNDLKNIITELWHISRTALATQDCSRHSRMIYIRNELHQRHSNLIEGMTAKQVWFRIEDVTTVV